MRLSPRGRIFIFVELLIVDYVSAVEWQRLLSILSFYVMLLRKCGKLRGGENLLRLSIRC